MVVFTDNGHIYKNLHSGEKYKSVSAVSKPFFGEFDEYFVSTRKAFKFLYPDAYKEALKTHRFDDKDIIVCLHNMVGPVDKQAKIYTDEWKAKREKGTAFHLKQENNDKRLGYVLHRDKKYIFKDLLRIPKGYDNVSAEALVDGYYPEFLAYCPEMLWAGQLDKLMVDGEYFDIDDWKTDSEISMEGFRGAHMNFPLSHLQDANYLRYSIKISLYAYMIEKMYGLKPRNLQLTHVVIDEDLNILESKVYPIMYRKWEIENIVEYCEEQSKKKF